MKTSNTRLPFDIFSKVFATIFAVLIPALIFAQNDTKKIDEDMKANINNGFFGSPWIWVVGIVVFILLLVALLRGSGRRSDA